jgi:hypothetical protein
VSDLDDAVLDDWTTQVCRELGLEDEVDVDAVLDLARVVAHVVERRAAPVTTFLVGLAAGGREGPRSAAEPTNAVMALARRWRRA